jgi:hypothetical protein
MNISYILNFILQEILANRSFPSFKEMKEERKIYQTLQLEENTFSMSTIHQFGRGFIKKFSLISILFYLYFAERKFYFLLTTAIVGFFYHCLEKYFESSYSNTHIFCFWILKISLLLVQHKNVGSGLNSPAWVLSLYEIAILTYFQFHTENLILQRIPYFLMIGLNYYSMVVTLDLSHQISFFISCVVGLYVMHSFHWISLIRYLIYKTEERRLNFERFLNSIPGIIWKLDDKLDIIYVSKKFLDKEPSVYLKKNVKNFLFLFDCLFL